MLSSDPKCATLRALVLGAPAVLAPGASFAEGWSHAVQTVSDATGREDLIDALRRHLLLARAQASAAKHAHHETCPSRNMPVTKHL